MPSDARGGREHDGGGEGGASGSRELMVAVVTADRGMLQIRPPQLNLYHQT